MGQYYIYVSHHDKVGFDIASLKPIIDANCLEPYWDYIRAIEMTWMAQIEESCMPIKRIHWDNIKFMSESWGKLGVHNASLIPINILFMRGVNQL